MTRTSGRKPARRTSRKKKECSGEDRKRHHRSDIIEERPENFYSILESLPDIVYRIDPQGNFTYINNSIRILGYEPSELLGKHFSMIVHPDDAAYLSRQTLLPRYVGHTTGNQDAPKLFDERRTGRRRTKGLEIRLLPKKTDTSSTRVIGSVIAFGDVTSAGYYSSGPRAKKRRFLGTLGIIRDITERRRAEEKLRYQADLLQNVSDAIISTDLDSTIRTWNHAAEKLYGWKAFEVIGKNAHTVTKQRFPDSTQKEVMRQFMKNGYWRGEITQVCKDGSQLNVLTSLSLIRDSAGNAVGMVSVNRDITERKKAEVALAVANERLKKLQLVTTAVHSTLDISTVFKRVSNGFIDTLDFNAALIFMKNQAKNTYDVKSITAKRGIITKISKILGHPVHRMKIPLDTDNEAVRALQQDRAFVSDTLAEIVYPFLNKRMCRTLQRLRKSKKFIVLPLKIGNDLAGGVFLTSPRSTVSEAELNVATLFTRAAANAINNAHLHIQTTEAERALRKSEEKYRDLVENTAVGIATTDLRGRLTYVNDTLCGMIGYKKKEILGKPFVVYLHPDDKKNVLAWFNRLLSAAPQRTDLEFRCIHKRGHTVYMYSSPTVFKYQDTTIGFNTIIQNITERKQAEQALRESEARWRSLTEHSPDQIMMLDTDATILYMNRPIPGQHRDTVIGTSFYSYPTSKNQTTLQKTIDEVRSTHRAATIEHMTEGEDGSRKHFELHIGPVLHGGNVTSFIVRSADVTERKKQEERLTNSLREKEALLREIHHRVKNNLQIIYSLLNLQVGYLDSARYKRLFQESQDRIKSMVLIHETLYQSENLADINPAEYINSLIKYLSHTYNIQKHNIQVRTHIDELAMDIDTAIPCGLIINELVSNAIKYAFPGNMHNPHPEIHITLKQDSGHRVILTIADNGKGIPPDIDFENTRTLGLQLVHALTQQIKGTLTVQRNRGTVFTIRFPYKDTP